MRDTQGFVIVGARVVLRAAGPEATVSRTAVTDSRGRFRFTGVEERRYRVEADFPGFERLAREADPAQSELFLELEPAGQHDGVVVTAARQDTETSRLTLPTSLVSAETFREQMPTNLAETLADIPGVTWVNAGAFRSRPVIRGLDSNRILVLVDGERLNNNRTSTNQGGIETSLVDPSDIQQVEVVRGPGSVMYGSDAFGGVVNIRTRNSLPRDGLGIGGRLGAVAMPNSDGRRAYAELSGGNRRFTARARGSAGALQNYNAPGGPVYFSGADESSALGDVRVYPDDTQSAWAKLFHRAGYNFGLPSLDPNPAFLAEFPFSKLTKFSGGYQKSFASRALSSLRTNVYTQAQDRSFFNRIAAGPRMQILSETVTNIESTGFDVQATSVPTPQHVLTYGVSYYRDSNRDARLQQMLGAGPLPVVLDDAPSVPNSTFSGAGVFFQEQFEPSSRVRINAGLRADRFALGTSSTPNFDPDVAASVAGNRTDSALGGSLGASVDIGAGFTASGNFGRAFRAPNLFERYFFGRGSVGGFIVPNPEIEPETSLQLDTGVHFRRGAVKASVNYFVNSLDNLISSAAGTFNGRPELAGQPVFQNVNISQARIQGVETTVETRTSAADSEWTLAFNAAWQRGTNQATNQPLPLIAPFLGQAKLRWSPRRSKLWSEIGTSLAASSNRVPEGFTPIRGYTVFTWRAGYQLVRGEYGLGSKLPAGLSSVSFYAGLENLGNRRYFGLFETVPRPGRDFRFGMDLSLDSSAK